MRWKPFLVLAFALLFVACSGDTSSTSTRQDASGGSAGAGGSGSGGANGSGGSSAAGSGGAAASGGSGGCGPCPGVACGPAVQLYVQAEADAGSLDLENLRVEVPGIDVRCMRNGASCQYFCQAVQYQIPNGHYRVSVTAVGFSARTIEFDAVAPTNCGCCGCCPFSFNQQLSLTPDGTPAASCPQ